MAKPFFTGLRSPTAYGFNRLQGQVDLFLPIEIAEAEADRSPGEGPDGTVGRWGAVQSWAAENPEALVEVQGRLRGGNAGHVEGDHRRPSGGSRGAVNRDPAQRGQSSEEMGRKRLLMLSYFIQPLREDKTDPRPQSGDPYRIGRPRLILVGKEIGLGLMFRTASRPPTHEGPQSLLQTGADIEPAGSLGSEEGFVAGERQ